MEARRQLSFARPRIRERMKFSARLRICDINRINFMLFFYFNDRLLDIPNDSARERYSPCVSFLIFALSLRRDEARGLDMY